MKPQFALDLSHTGIRLLQLQGKDDVELGQVALDDPAFDRRVYDLYLMAAERAKGRVRTMLLIPNSEVLYSRVETGNGDREARAKAVADALEGMTPYALDELVFDWRTDGDEAVVAAVANLTLEEAEAFAADRGFNPMGFSSRPVNGAFKGIPNFGQTKLAAARRAGAPWPDPPQPPEAPAEAGPDAEPGAEASADRRAEAALADVSPSGQSAAPDTDTAGNSAAHPQVSDDIPERPADERPEPDEAAEVHTENAPEGTSEARQPAVLQPDHGAALLDAADAALAEVPDPVTKPQKDPQDVSAQDEAAAEVPVPEVQDAPDRGDPAAPSGPQENAAPPPTQTDEAQSDTDTIAALAVGAADAAKPKPAAKKRGAGRASGGKGRGKEAGKAKPKAAARGSGRNTPAKAGPPPAFSSRRHAAPGDSADIAPETQAENQAGSQAKPAADAGNGTDRPAAAAATPSKVPPPRPPNLPPVGAAAAGAAPPPPRPKIPPHLVKPSAPPGSLPPVKATAWPAAAKPSGKPAKGSRLAQLMTRLQSASDNAQAPPAKATPDIPDLPKPPPAAARKARKSDPPLPPLHEMPLPKQAASGAPGSNGALPDPSAVSASLTPGLPAPNDAAKGTTLPPPRKLSRSGLDEAQSMTLFGARSDRKDRSLKPALIGIAVLLVLSVAVWAGVILLGRGPAATTSRDAGSLGLAEPATAPAPSTPGAAAESGTPIDIAALPPANPVTVERAPEPDPVAIAAPSGLPVLPGDTPPDLPQSDAPVLEAPGGVAEAPALGSGDTGPTAQPAPPAAQAPTPDNLDGPQLTAQPLPNPANRQQAESRYAALGIWQIPPDPPDLPEASRLEELRLAALAGTTSFAALPSLALPRELAAPNRPLASPAPTPLAPVAPAAEPPAVAEVAPAADEPAGTEAPADIVAAAPVDAPLDAPVDAPPVAAAPETPPQRAPAPETVRIVSGAPAVTPPARPSRPVRLRDIVPVNPEGVPALKPLSRPEGLAERQQDTALEPQTEAPEPGQRNSPTSAVALAAPSTGSAANVPSAPEAASLAAVALAPRSEAPQVAAEPAVVAPTDTATTLAALSETTADDVPAAADTTEVALLAPATRAEPPLRPLARPGRDPNPAIGTPTEAAPPLRPAARPETVTRAATDLGSTAALAADPNAAALGSAAGLTRIESPPARPANFASLVTSPDLAPATTEAPTPPAAPGPAALAETAVADGNAPLPDSPYAVISSRKPKTRPKSLERQIERARKTTPGPAVPAAATVRPTAPSSATVAKTATEANVLNLARMNLIGVYGSNTDRRALVRLASGRFVKVEVGDRLDGGRVASISDSSLRYTKGGQSITLKMPRG